MPAAQRLSGQRLHCPTRLALLACVVLLVASCGRSEKTVPVPVTAVEDPAPVPTLPNALLQSWDEVSLSADGRTRAITYFGGRQNCYPTEAFIQRKDGDQAAVWLYLGRRMGDYTCTEEGYYGPLLTVDVPEGVDASTTFIDPAD